LRFNRESGVIEDDNISGEYDIPEGGKVRVFHQLLLDYAGIRRGNDLERYGEGFEISR
jgi:hypothetical protein